MNITEQLKEILGGVKDAVNESPWAQGFDDCMLIIKPKQLTGKYAEGYKYASELGGERLCQLIYMVSNIKQLTREWGSFERSIQAIRF